MIRAHLATFPPREAIFRQVVDTILPQVDRLFIVFNGYAAIPADIAANPAIEAVIPDRDLRDAGKFLFTPDPDDIVFTIDDDLAYPADYVEASIRHGAEIGWDGKIMGYLGFSAGARPDGAFRWNIHYLRNAVEQASPVTMLGTGSVFARGDMLPDLAVVEAYRGAVDVGLAKWAAAHDVGLTMMPRPEKWLRNALPKELAATSIHKTDSRNPPPHVRIALASLARVARAHQST